MKLHGLVLATAGLAIGPVGCTGMPTWGELIEPASSQSAAEPQAAAMPELRPEEPAEAARTEPVQTARVEPDEPKREVTAAAAVAEPPRIAGVSTAGALSADEVTALLTGNSLYSGGSGSRFAALHQSGGALNGKTWSGEDTETGIGRWRVEPEGSYCRKWDNGWAGGEWGCFKLFRQGNALTLERVSGAGANSQMTLVQGNAYDL